mgnify:CR=1 FL=1
MPAEQAPIEQTPVQQAQIAEAHRVSLTRRIWRQGRERLFPDFPLRLCRKDRAGILASREVDNSFGAKSISIGDFAVEDDFPFTLTGALFPGAISEGA